ncbi:hypothetical protein OGAPHI_005996 [Ogataea philodendri]|uniref:Uncharacterized protein n=1 Tax=Ogataea philodendri TaxID=1378263 RepID=A0A9P8T0J0_9ASCO|nr:uncharacterized protein OGAPHI_005996 [Ogataea philodendri]KAH3661818.1 hypothetical protein OGAPHI_005996 [Ogataea philodendri]
MGIVPMVLASNTGLALWEASEAGVEPESVSSGTMEKGFGPWSVSLRLCWEGGDGRDDCDCEGPIRGNSGNKESGLIGSLGLEMIEPLETFLFLFWYILLEFVSSKLSSNPEPEPLMPWNGSATDWLYFWSLLGTASPTTGLSVLELKLLIKVEKLLFIVFNGATYSSIGTIISPTFFC